jgi:hypothetical protein
MLTFYAVGGTACSVIFYQFRVMLRTSEGRPFIWSPY